MDESPFEPARPVYRSDEADRLDASKRRIRQLKTRKAAAGGMAAVLAVGGVIAGVALTSHGAHQPFASARLLGSDLRA